ncbi:MAG: hypothetical protein IKL14_02025 [Alphaproteobacteria bacterium]|nr:hypothetical protein [Alphaproteobacteria bacterium]
MRKFLTTGLFGAILGIVIGGAPADASLISRSFLDEALTSYATTTALDLKANQSDLTDLSDKIGTLPSGIFPIFPGSERLFPYLNQPFRYPTSLAELITALYGNSETGARGLLEGIIYGFPYIQYGDDRPDGYIGLITNSSLATEAKELANANTAKIGDLPTEYTTVGAALTAMDAKIDARELPSTSADGQYVLSAKKVGDTITYTWVKMDLTSEEQAQ